MLDMSLAPMPDSTGLLFGASALCGLAGSATAAPNATLQPQHQPTLTLST